MLSAANNIMAREIYLGSGEVDDSGGENGNLEDLTNQCQRYEEQIVELHSVIAELSRKLEIEQDQIIHEETESSGEEPDEEIDSDCLDFGEDDDREVYNPTNKIILNRRGFKQQQQDYNSLVFERDLDSQLTGNVVDLDKGEHIEETNIVREGYRDNGIMGSRESFNKQLDKTDLENGHQNVLYKIELFDQLQQELVGSKKEMEQLRELLTLKDGEKDSIVSERNALKRQLDDLQATMEYQEAKMDLQKKPAIGSGGSRKSSTTSSRLQGSGPGVDILLDPCIPAILNAIPAPDLDNGCEKDSSSSRKQQRRRSLRKPKKSSSSIKEKVTT